MYQSDPLIRAAEAAGIHFAYDMTTDRAAAMAQDALPPLVTTPNSGIPSFLATYIDPSILEIRVSPMKAAVIYGEEKTGDWTTEVAMFPIVERAGFVSSYGDYSNDGMATGNFTFPQRQQYRYQGMIQYGELEVAKVGLAKINWLSELQRSLALAMNKFENRSYFFGVAGLQNYGLLNDPALTAAISPGTKAAGNGNVWVYNGLINATLQEMYNDVLSLFNKLVSQSAGVVDGEVDMDEELVLALHPTTSVALKQLNTLTSTISLEEVLRKSFPKLRIETAVEYSTAAGYEIQLIAPNAGGQRTGFASFSEKLRAHQIIRDVSSMRQKVSGGTWGWIGRQPWAIASMLGV